MVDKPGNTTRAAKWRSFAVNALILVIIVAGIRLWQHRDMPSGAAPALQGVTLDGRPYALAAQPGKPVLVHFWATWCPICRAEQDSIAALAQQNPDVITVAMQSGTAAEVSRHMQQQGLSFPVINDSDGRLSGAWGVHAVPASFIVAPDGHIRFVEVGYTTGFGLRLRLWLARI